MSYPREAWASSVLSLLVPMKWAWVKAGVGPAEPDSLVKAGVGPAEPDSLVKAGVGPAEPDSLVKAGVGPAKPDHLVKEAVLVDLMQSNTCVSHFHVNLLDLVAALVAALDAEKYHVFHFLVSLM